MSQLVGADGTMTPELVVQWPGRGRLAAGSHLKRWAHRCMAAEVGEIIPRLSE